MKIIPNLGSIFEIYILKLFLKATKSLLSSLNIGITKLQICIIYNNETVIIAAIFILGIGNKSVAGV